MYYRQHKKIHSKPFGCESCSKSFATRYDLIRHIDDMHRVGGLRFICKINDCSFKTKRQYKLSQHIRRKHSRHLLRPNGCIETFEEPPSSGSETNEARPDPNFAHDLSQGSIMDVFMEAASTGNIPLLEYWLERGIDAGMSSENGYTALHCASRTGQVAMIQCLLKKGAIVDPSNSKMRGRRPIHEAITGNHPEAVVALLHAGADLFLPDNNDQTVIDYVGLSGDLEMAQALFRAESEQICAADLAAILAQSSIKAGKCSVLRWLLSRFPQAVPQFEDLKKSPIYIATTRGHKSILEILLCSSKSLSTSNAGFDKPASYSLLEATKRGAVEMVKSLLECNAVNVNQKNTYGMTALLIAFKQGNLRVIDLLLRHHRCDINIVVLPLLELLKEGRMDVVKLILSRHDLDVHQLRPVDLLGDTLLHIAAREGHTDIVQVLLTHNGIDTQCKNKRGRTPLESAFFNRKWDASRIIAEHICTVLGLYIRPKERETLGVTSDYCVLLTKCLLNRRLLSTDFWEWETIVHEMVLSDATKFAELLLDQPWFNVNMCVEWSAEHTILHTAAQYHSHNIFSLFLEQPRIDVNRRISWKSQNTDSVLHCAVQHNCITMTKLLLARPDTDLTLRNGDGYTALDLARVLERSEMVQLLLDTVTARSRRLPILSQHEIQRRCFVSWDTVRWENGI
jgi:ankyrin repeat protein